MFRIRIDICVVRVGGGGTFSPNLKGNSSEERPDTIAPRRLNIEACTQQGAREHEAAVEPDVDREGTAGELSRCYGTHSMCFAVRAYSCRSNTDTQQPTI